MVSRKKRNLVQVPTDIDRSLVEELRNATFYMQGLDPSVTMRSQLVKALRLWLGLIKRQMEVEEFPTRP